MKRAIHYPHDWYGDRHACGRRVLYDHEQHPYPWFVTCRNCRRTESYRAHKRRIRRRIRKIRERAVA